MKQEYQCSGLSGQNTSHMHSITSIIAQAHTNNTQDDLQLAHTADRNTQCMGSLDTSQEQLEPALAPEFMHLQGGQGSPSLSHTWLAHKP